jgi:ATP/maltotriose-dependent transcriptional regulator MalT
MPTGISTLTLQRHSFVSENTVKTHASRLLDKLDVNRRRPAVHVAKSWGSSPEPAARNKAACAAGRA